MEVLVYGSTRIWKYSYSERYYHKYTQVFMYSTGCSCRILIKLTFSRQTFEKSPNIIFHENPSIGSRVVPCGQTDRHDEVNSHLSEFGECT